MDLWDKSWRVVKLRASYVVYSGMVMVAELRRRSPGSHTNAKIIAQFPEVVDCALRLLDGAEHDAVDAADFDRAVALLASLPPVTGKRWRARGCSVLATWNQRCFRVARVHEPDLAAAIAGIPELLEALKYLRDTQQSEPVCHVEVTGLSALERQTWLCFASAMDAPHPRHWSSAGGVGRGFARPSLPAGPAGKWHGQMGGPPAGSTTAAPGVRFGPERAAPDEREPISA